MSKVVQETVSPPLTIMLGLSTRDVLCRTPLMITPDLDSSHAHCGPVKTGGCEGYSQPSMCCWGSRAPSSCYDLIHIRCKWWYLRGNPGVPEPAQLD